MKTHTSHKQHKGSALVTVLMLTMAAALMAGALCAYSMSERKLNRHALLLLQAQDGARALLEFGSSQLAVDLLASPNIPIAYLQNHHLSFYKSQLSAMYSNSNNPTFFQSSSGNNNYIITTTPTTTTTNATYANLYGSALTNPGSEYIDPTLTYNVNDPLAGNTVTTQAVYLMAEVTAKDVNNNQVTDYAMQEIELRNSSLLNNAIFYNVPMEFHPSPKMDVYGPVFANQNAYLTEGNTLSFHNKVTIAGLFSAQPLDDVAGAGESRPQGQNIFFLDKAGTAELSINDPDYSGKTLGTWADSYLNGTENGGPSPNQSPNSDWPGVTFDTVANSLWGGNLEDGNNAGVTQQNLAGIPNAATAQQIIQPPDPTQSSNQSAANYSAVEAQKFANEAGLYIVVTPNNAGGNGASVVAFYGTGIGNQQNAMSYIYASIGATEAGSTKNTGAQRAAWLSSHSSDVLFTNNIAGQSATSTNTLAGIVNTQRLMFDPREGKLLNTVDIDMGALAAAIDPTTPKLTTSSVGGTAWTADTAATGWNGVVYVDVETDVSGNPTGWSTTSDIPQNGTNSDISGAGTETAVRLVDGESLPSRPNGNNNGGITVATNAPVYVIGNFNADGTLPGGANPSSAQVMTPDSIANGNGVNEVPAMIAADAIDILSSSWWGAPNSTKFPNDPNGEPLGDGQITTNTGAYNGEPTAGNTEVAAAFIAGIVPTNTTAYAYSGGVENYMRFNEDWSAATIRYRGAIVALYDSAVATGPWPNAKYGAPVRQWGYDNMFGVSRDFPPGTPSTASLRRWNYKDIPGSTFTANLTNVTYGFQLMY
jgi:hypothetical protein